MGTVCGIDVCGELGSPVSMQNLSCTGGEIELSECSWAAADEACLTHKQDSVIFCSRTSASPIYGDGSVRLLSADGAPSPGGTGRLEVFQGGAWAPVCSEGFSQGAASVACKQMGFSGGAVAAGHQSCTSSCQAPGFSDMACTGEEASVLECPHAAGEETYCAPQEAVSLSCDGTGDTTGRPIAIPAAAGI